MTTEGAQPASLAPPELETEPDASLPQGRSLSLWQMFSFSLMSAPLAMGGLVLVFFLPTFYAVEMGLGLTAVGLVFALGRVFDVFTDPLIGNLSDETRSRWGARRPWIVLGVPVYCLTIWMLLAPPDDIGLMYLIGVGALYFLAYTAVDVPYSSIGLEVSPHVHERSYLASFKAVFQVTGAISAAALVSSLAADTGAALSAIGTVIVVLTGAGLVMFLVFMPNRDRAVQAPRQAFWTATRQVLSVRRFRVLVICFMIVQAANALTAGLLVLFVTQVIGAPMVVAGALPGLIFACSAVFLPLWLVLSKRRSKQGAWAASMLLCSVGLLSAFALGEGQLIAAAVLCMVVGACFGCDAIMPTSMLADIVYDFELKGENKLAGVFLAIKNAVSKLAFVVPMAIAFPLLDLVGFDGAGANEASDLLVLTGLFAGVPIVLRLAAFVILRRAGGASGDIAGAATDTPQQSL